MSRLAVFAIAALVVVGLQNSIRSDLNLGGFTARNNGTPQVGELLWASR